MQIPSIAIINFASEMIDQDVQDAIRAVNRQVVEDFMPLWGCGRMSKLYEASFDPADEDSLVEEKVPGDAVIYLVDEGSLPGALGYHSINSAELPIGFVFVNPGDWTITLSHEVLELIVDPSVNNFVPGPDPRDFDDSEKWLLHAYEVCDAVERVSYKIDAIELSDFVTPSYFSKGDSQGTRNDFLGTGVVSFGLLPGCHLGVIDPQTFDFEQITRATRRSKNKACATRFVQYARPLRQKKPKRPSDERFAGILHRYNENPPKNCKPLPNLSGVTRTGRIRAAADELYWE